MNKKIKKLAESGMNVKYVQPGKKKWSLKSWQATLIALFLVEVNAILKATCLKEFPFAEVNIFLVWFLGLYLAKRTAQKSPKLGGGNDIGT
ncbi:hypothetical protein ES703_124886 [subsurface metagenome]